MALALQRSLFYNFVQSMFDEVKRSSGFVFFILFYFIFHLFFYCLILKNRLDFAYICSFPFHFNYYTFFFFLWYCFSSFQKLLVGIVSYLISFSCFSNFFTLIFCSCFSVLFLFLKLVWKFWSFSPFDFIIILVHDFMFYNLQDMLYCKF